MAVNKIGLEAEFLLKNSDGKLVYPCDHGFETDDFVLIGEFKGKCGKTRAEAIANFLHKFYEVDYAVKRKGLSLDISGYSSVSPKLYSEVIRRMGTKQIATAKNINPDLDILHLSDAVVKDGRILSHKISCGLHVHFSSLAIKESKLKIDKTTYIPVSIPIGLEKVSATLELYRRDIVKEEEVVVKATSSCLTKPVVRHIVKEFDEKVLPQFMIEEPYKYRNPGFYETKPHGFEYRSLPFTGEVMSRISEIVDFAFNQLEDLPC